MLMLPPAERRYVWSPVWAVDGGDPSGEPDVVGFPTALEGMGCEDCRFDMVVSHVEVLARWSDMARELVEGSERGDRRREELARVLVFFAGDLGRAVSSDGVLGDDDAELAGMAMAAIAEATVAASLLLSQSFSKQLASTL